jgi:hypothetical protein
LNRDHPRSLAAAFVVAIALCASSCAVPLAPGYRILQESREVRFVSGQPPELQIGVRYKLVNSGSSDLRFVDAIFPEEEAFGRKDLRVEVDGREAPLASLPPEYQQDEPNALRIALDPPWTRKQTRELTIAYAFREPQGSGARITLGGDDFHLGSREWFPRLQPPKHLLAPYPKRPDRAVYTVRVPAGFVVLARGAAKGRKENGGEIAYRFELRARDLAPFVVAGRYAAWPRKPNSHAPVFWTLQPLKDDPGPAAEGIMAAWKALEKDFGPLEKNIAAPHIVEAPGLRGHFAGEEGAAPAAVAFPGGALANPAAFALGTGSERFLEIVTHALAHNWFGDAMYPSADAALGMGEGLPEYAAIVVEEARRGAAARRRRAIEYLRRYDEARNFAAETPLGVTTLHDPIAQRRIALAKAPLFFVALEDACGPAPVRSGLAHLVSLMRGQEVDYNDLRAALEQATGRKLGEMFRVWLNRKGIPEDFRNRYQPGAAAEEALR